VFGYLRQPKYVRVKIHIHNLDSLSFFLSGELTLHNDSSERELRNIKGQKENMMVEENLLKLEIKRLRDQLVNRASKVLSLEDRRLLLETAMKERRQEIQMHTDMLKAQVKSSEEERQKIRFLYYVYIDR